MRHTRPGRYEYEIAAELMHEYGRHNATSAYQPIVGGGANSCILHYRENESRLEEGGPAAGGCGRRVPVLRLGHHAHLASGR